MNQSRYRSGGGKNTSHFPSCVLCHKNYDAFYHVPRVPKCGHTFCEKCITQNLQVRSNRRIFTCPECSVDVVVRRNINEEIPKNMLIVDIVNDLKKNNYVDQNQLEVECPHHHKKLEMICYSCKNVRICPHCAIFGEHKGHQIGNEPLATQNDIKYINESLATLESSLQLLMPDSEQNLEIKSKEQIKEGLTKIIKITFKQYYDRIHQKQQSLLRQCEQISIDGTIGNSIDRILISYDNLKIWYQNKGKSITSSDVDQIMSKTQNIHDEVQKISEQFNNKVMSFLSQATKNINNHIFFKIQQCSSSSLKEIISGQDKIQKVSISRQSSKKKQDYFRNTNTFNANNSGVKTKQKNYQQPKSLYYNSISAYDDEEILITQNKIEQSQADSLNIQNMIQCENSPIKRYSENIDLQLSEIKKIPQANKSTNMTNICRNIPKNIEKNRMRDSQQKQTKVSTSRSNINKKNEPTKASTSKSKINENNFMGNCQDELKYVRLTKQINYEQRSKYQSIIAQIDRQSKQSSNSLELIGYEITDLLIAHICEYLITKKIKFSMMKFVKNSITDEGFRILLSYLLTDNFTKVLNMTSNHLSGKSIDLVAKFITKNNILKSIYLSNNKISPMHLKKKKSLFDSNFVEVII